MKALLIILSSVAILVTGVYFRDRVSEAEVWKELSQRLPSKTLTPQETHNTSDPVTTILSPDGDQVGNVRLPNGEIWRFAFRSHHLLKDAGAKSLQRREF